MNRFKKEEKRKREEARRGLSQEEIAELDVKEALQEEIICETKELHTQIFPEEYEFLGVSPVDSMGIPTSNDSWQRCLSFIKRKKRNNKLDKDK